MQLRLELVDGPPPRALGVRSGRIEPHEALRAVRACSRGPRRRREDDDDGDPARTGRAVMHLIVEPIRSTGPGSSSKGRLWGAMSIFMKVPPPGGGEGIVMGSRRADTAELAERGLVGKVLLKNRATVRFRYTWLPMAFAASQIMIATMFLRWHYLIDICAGLLLATSGIFMGRVALAWDEARVAAGGMRAWPPLG
jgi:hypothetical protein